MATSGPNSSGTASEHDLGSAAGPWTTPNNIFASDNSYATRVLTSGQESKYLIASNFGFSIPTGATIDGFVVEVECKASVASTLTFVTAVFTPDGTFVGQVGSDYSDYGVYIGTSDAYKTFGGAADSWGRTWTVSEVNASGFGFIMRIYNDGGSTSTASVDHIRITVYYTPAPGSIVPMPHSFTAVARASFY